MSPTSLCSSKMFKSSMASSRILKCSKYGQVSSILSQNPSTEVSIPLRRLVLPCRMVRQSLLRPSSDRKPCLLVSIAEALLSFNQFFIFLVLLWAVLLPPPVQCILLSRQTPYERRSTSLVGFEYYKEQCLAELSFFPCAEAKYMWVSSCPMNLPVNRSKTPAW